MSESDLHRLAVAVETLSGTMREGFATVRGDINVLSTREARNAEDIRGLEERTTRLEDRRFPLTVTNGIMSVAAVALSLYVALGK